MSCISNDYKKYAKLNVHNEIECWCVELPDVDHVYEFIDEEEADKFIKGYLDFINE